MNDTLVEHTNTIIDHALVLLNGEKGELNEKQYGFIKTIIANAEKFIHLAAEFEAASLDMITSDMRHNLGNPLTPMIGYSELLIMGLMGGLNNDQFAHAQAIWESTSSLKDDVDEAVARARQYAMVAVR